MLRDHGVIEGEPGDINYKVADSDIVNPYHLFNEGELKKLFVAAGYREKEVDISVVTICSSNTISQSPILNYADFLLSSSLSCCLPFGERSQYSSYLGATTKKPETQPTDFRATSIIKSQKIDRTL